MAWMSEAEYELKQDCMEKKITARSAKSTRTHCGKSGAVKFPSDYLSKKELNAMNGECKSYRMNAPMSWKEFKSMPADLQRDYIRALRKTYNVPNNALAEMFGVTPQSVNKYLPEIGLAVGKAAGGKRIWNKEGFLAWRCGASAGAVDETPVEEDEIDEIADELIAINDIPEIEVILDDSCFDPENAPHICDNPYHHIPVIPSTGTMTFMNNRADDILGTIKSILCDTRVNVTISWEFVSGE